MVLLPTQLTPVSMICMTIPSCERRRMNLKQAKRILDHLERYEKWSKQEDIDIERGVKPEQRVQPPGVPRDSDHLIQLLKDSIALEKFRKRHKIL